MRLLYLLSLPAKRYMNAARQAKRYPWTPVVSIAASLHLQYNELLLQINQTLVLSVFPRESEFVLEALYILPHSKFCYRCFFGITSREDTLDIRQASLRTSNAESEAEFSSASYWTSDKSQQASQ